MKQLPPFALSFALLFWAWQSNQWIAAAVAAVWLEWALRTNRRWQISNDNIHRIVDLTSLALIGVALYEYQSGPFAQSIFTMLQWSPLLFLPLLSAQLLSGRQGLERRAIYYSKRKSHSPSAKKEVDLLFPYFAACLMAPALSPANLTAYLPGVALILAWLLWWNRPKHRNIASWVTLLVVAIGLGYLGQIGLRHVQTELENAAIEWLSDQFSDSTNPYKARTSLGDIGELKLSDKILYRVETDKPLYKPLLLRTASYNRYIDTSWFNHHRKFEPERPLVSGDTWQWLQPDALQEGAPSRWARISLYLNDKKNILPLPTATEKIDQLPVIGLSRHPLGAIQVEDGPDLVKYKAHFNIGSSSDTPPEKPDLSIPRQEQAVIKQVAKQLDLSNLGPVEAAQRIKKYLQEQFYYTLDLPGKRPDQTELSHFLLERRRGHCEYFASATVLLLRQAGIPARYAVGYSTQETTGIPRQYVVRISHAHAWAQYWHDGKWWELDTTPSNWYQLEENQASSWRPLLDLFSNLYYQFAGWQIDQQGEKHSPLLWGVLAILFLILGYRLRPGKAFVLKREEKSREEKQLPKTPLSAIEATLVKNGLPRHRWETYGTWLKRLQQHHQLPDKAGELEKIVQLHYRFRYQHGNLSKKELQHMQTLTDSWLRRYKSTQSSLDS